jgi:Antibiotic biosynthesis monooxygenase
MSDQDGPLFLVVTIRPRLDRMAEAHLVQPHDDPDSWLMLEMFRSRAAWDEHMRRPYNTEGNRILEDLLREPSELRLCSEKQAASQSPTGGRSGVRLRFQ